MNVFVSEYVSGGALSNCSLPESLLREGRAMLAAIVSDLLMIPGCTVATTLDRRLCDRSDLTISPRLSIEEMDDGSAEEIAFDRLSGDADATLVIAPETDGTLLDRVQRVRNLKASSLNCLPEGIALCGDKLKLADHLISRGIATIPTLPLSAVPENPWREFGQSCVVKPCDGAGSVLTFLVPHHDCVAWDLAMNSFAASNATAKAIVQPLIAGKALSVACVCDEVAGIEVFPVASQHLDSRNFQYLGGTIPAAISSKASIAIERLVRAACSTIVGLRGYVGVDVLLPDNNPESPVIVEINPRLTTSYIGYRQICRGNIARRLLVGALQPQTEYLHWKHETVSFTADRSDFESEITLGTGSTSNFEIDHER